MSKLTSVGFTPPPDFPTEAHNKVHQYLNKYKDTHNVQWSLFGLGWNGLSYRYRAAAEYDYEFTSSVKKFGNSPPPEERYNQEKALFGFFVNAVSVIGCFFFSTYFMASILKSEEFPFSKSEELKLYPKDVALYFTKHFPKDNLTNKMNECLNADTYKQMNKMRIVLFHRGMLPRKFYAGGERNGMATMPINPRASSNQWQFDFSVDEQTTTSLRQWLCSVIKDLLDSTFNFCTRKLP